MCLLAALFTKVLGYNVTGFVQQNHCIKYKMLYLKQLYEDSSLLSLFLTTFGSPVLKNNSVQNKILQHICLKSS